MAIPNIQSVMLPLLRLLEDGEEHVRREYIEDLALHFEVTAEERRQLLPSGKQTTFVSRVGWATTSLAKAGLIERTGTSRIRLTERGREALRVSPQGIDNAYLSQFPEFVAYSRRRSRGDGGESSLSQVADPSSEAQELSPEELLELSFQELREALAEELLVRIKRSPPAFFENLVVDLLVAMGYGGSRRDAGQAVGGSGDDGIDGIIKEDKLGLDFVYVQAKRWESPVSRPIVQAFAGSLEGQRARKGVLITTSTFTREATEYVTRIEKRIVLVNGEQLATLMIDHGVGVTDVATYHVKRIDADYFGEE